jgi:hypothetical protein
MCHINLAPTLQKPHQENSSKSSTPTTFLPFWATIVDDKIVKYENYKNLPRVVRYKHLHMNCTSLVGKPLVDHSR